MILYQLAKWMEEQNTVPVQAKQWDVHANTNRWQTVQHLQPPTIKEWSEHFPTMIQAMERFQKQDPYS